jgi:hypothetical protein
MSDESMATEIRVTHDLTSDVGCGAFLLGILVAAIIFNSIGAGLESIGDAIRALAAALEALS